LFHHHHLDRRPVAELVVVVMWDGNDDNRGRAMECRGDGEAGQGLSLANAIGGGHCDAIEEDEDEEVDKDEESGGGRTKAAGEKRKRRLKLLWSEDFSSWDIFRHFASWVPAMNNQRGFQESAYSCKSFPATFNL
jgi:hypothetical protein